VCFQLFVSISGGIRAYPCFQLLRAIEKSFGMVVGGQLEPRKCLPRVFQRALYLRV
jgi:hypothetical protein